MEPLKGSFQYVIEITILNYDTTYVIYINLITEIFYDLSHIYKEVSVQGN